MNKLSYKIKIIMVLAGFAVLALGMFLYGYGILSARNQTTADAVAKQRVELEVLEREQKSFEQGKKDLAQLEESDHPPDELFSNDTKVVKEIQQLETAAKLYDLDLDISVTGTTTTAVRVPGTGANLFGIPYTVTLDGAFTNILLFMQAIEHLPFVTHVNGLGISVSEQDGARTTLNSEFYIKK